MPTKKKRTNAGKKMVKYRRKAPMYRGIPDRMRIRLNWCGQGTLSQATGGIMALEQTSINSIYDPDKTNSFGNHQPAFFDTYCNALYSGTGLYHKYRVHGVRYKVLFLNSDTNVEHDVGIVAVPHGNVIAATDNFQAICQNKWARIRSIGTNSSGSNKAIVSGYISVKKLEGERSLASINYAAQYNANPSFSGSLYVFARAMDGSSTVGAVLCRISLQYDIEFFDKIYRSSTD